MNDSGKNAREAFRFDLKAKSFLKKLGFELVNDPAIVTSPYQQTRAIYGAPYGLFIGVWFEPADSNSVCVNFGRRWSGNRVDFVLSNNYSMFCAEYGMKLPEMYKLGYGDEIDRTIDKVFKDIERTLKTVIENIDIHTVHRLEEAKNGAKQWAEMLFGNSYSEHLKIDKFKFDRLPN